MKVLLNAVIVACLVVALRIPAQAQLLVAGGGESLINGGFGDPPVPLKGHMAFRIDRLADGTISGSFDCIALAPTSDTGAFSGQFTKNIMYVTGKITSLDSFSKDAASFSGTSTVTGVGAGQNLPFTCEVTPGPGVSGKGAVGVTPGGAGATMVLTVSGLTFNEVLTSGGIHINVPKEKGKKK